MDALEKDAAAAQPKEGAEAVDPAAPPTQQQDEPQDAVEAAPVVEAPVVEAVRLGNPFDGPGGPEPKIDVLKVEQKVADKEEKRDEGAELKRVEEDISLKVPVEAAEVKEQQQQPASEPQEAAEKK